MAFLCCNNEQCGTSTSFSGSVHYRIESLKPSRMVNCDKVETSVFLDLDKSWAVANSKLKTSKVNMFLRAQNREFFGMTESNESK